jgi:hypothetical protein
MEYYEVFLSKITKNRYPDIYDNLDIEKMKKLLMKI